MLRQQHWKKTRPNLGGKGDQNAMESLKDRSK